MHTTKGNGAPTLAETERAIGDAIAAYVVGQLRPLLERAAGEAPAATGNAAPKRRHTMTAAAKANIRRAQRARWKVYRVARKQGLSVAEARKAAKEASSKHGDRKG